MDQKNDDFFFGLDQLSETAASMRVGERESGRESESERVSAARVAHKQCGILFALWCRPCSSFFFCSPLPNPFIVTVVVVRVLLLLLSFAFVINI